MFFLKRLFRKKKDLREACREEYGDDFIQLYDMMQAGIPIGGLAETMLILSMIDKVREDLNERP